MKKPKIGFIGQGWIGKNLANNFEKRGYATVRYSLDPEYVQNKEKIALCDMVFIAVPTPSTPKGFDASLVEKVLPLVGKGKIAVIKSTVLPGTTKRLQKQFKNICVVHSPEFLSEATVVYDTDNPFCNIIGVQKNSAVHKKAAEEVLKVLPKAPFSQICTSDESEIIKYAHNCSGYIHIIFFNLLYDLAGSLGASWSPIEAAIKADPFIPNRYSNPVHKGGRGAGGHCFIKDFSALINIYKKTLPKSTSAINILRAVEKKNVELLLNSKKDLDLLVGVYGKGVIKKPQAAKALRGKK